MLARGIRPGPALAGTVGVHEIAAHRKRQADTARAENSASKRVKRVTVRSSGSDTNQHIAGTAVGAAIQRSRIENARKSKERQLALDRASVPRTKPG
jgi:K+-transporting ATPase c subunit